MAALTVSLMHICANRLTFPLASGYLASVGRFPSVMMPNPPLPHSSYNLFYIRHATKHASIFTSNILSLEFLFFEYHYRPMCTIARLEEL